MEDLGHALKWGHMVLVANKSIECREVDPVHGGDDAEDQFSGLCFQHGAFGEVASLNVIDFRDNRGGHNPWMADDLKLGVA